MLQPSSIRFALLPVLAALLLTSAVSHADGFDWFPSFGSDDPGPSQREPGPSFDPGSWLPWAPRWGGEHDDRNSAESRKARSEFESQSRKQLPIIVTKTEWTENDEANFGAFVSKMGAAIAARKCNTVKSCFKSKEANMYADLDPQSLIVYSDCAEFPYLMRAYFAYHNGLPFGYVTEVKMNERPVASLPTQDRLLETSGLDTDPYGNVIVARGGSNVPAQAGAEPNLISYLVRMFGLVSTRTLRVGALSPGYSLSDLYPVHINRDGIRPGTIVHSTGHALVIWNVSPKGAINAIDAHPDGSVQFKNIQPSTLDRSRPDQGLGFFRFRPLKLVGAKATPKGQLVGGKIVSETDTELFRAGKWSVEQWFGAGSKIAPGEPVDAQAWVRAFRSPTFFDYVASQLRDSNIQIQADSVVNDMMVSLCDQMQQRVADVDAYVKAGINKRQHPDTIPADIFGESEPTWAAYSTPGRDGRIRASVDDIIRTAASYFRMAKAGDKSIHFEGDASAYVATLRAHLSDMNKSCIVKYQNSRAKVISLSFNEVISRLGRISFDPYFCPEKAWGASGQELATCSDGDRGDEWYRAEQPMRNTAGKIGPGGVLVVRSTQAISLDMLSDPSLIDQPSSSLFNLGTSDAPTISLEAAFVSKKFMEQLTKPQ